MQIKYSTFFAAASSRMLCNCKNAPLTLILLFRFCYAIFTPPIPTLTPTQIPSHLIPKSGLMKLVVVVVVVEK